MGGGFVGRASRQHPNLSSQAPRTVDSDGATSAVSRIVLTLLAVDGVITAVVGALLFPYFLGVVPFPVSALLVGLANMALVWAAMQHSDSLLRGGLPLWTFLAAVVVLILGGPGDDVIFNGPNLYAFGSLIFIVVGALPAVWLLKRKNRL